MDDDLGPLARIRFEFASGEVIEALFHEREIEALKPGIPFRCDVPVGFGVEGVLAGLPRAEVPVGGTIARIHSADGVTVVEVR